MSAPDYVIEVLDSPLHIERTTWNRLLLAQDAATPFMRHEYLQAMQASASVCPETGWTPRCMTAWRKPHGRPPELHAACVLYLKTHSYGEYVFDHAWANAYRQRGLSYYPKALVASPFTPVTGARLLARDAPARRALARGLVRWCRDAGLSGLHVLFANEDDIAACRDAGMMLRHTVQFHWTNRPGGYQDFDQFLASLQQDKRKKIRQERRKVAQAGVRFRHAHGAAIAAADWDFFYRCYERTYREHGNPPYLRRDFFRQMTSQMPENWLMFIAERAGQPIAASLVALSGGAGGPAGIAYGRYWGALERVDCLHFEACYYQPLSWCIAHGLQRFEGGAQGEHKMARALLPVHTRSAHWLAHAGFAQAVENFLEREQAAIGSYLEQLELHSPFKPTPH